MMIFVARIAYWIGYGSRSIASNRRSFARGVARIKELLEGVPNDVLKARSRVAPRTGLTPRMLDWSVFMTIEHTDEVHVQILQLITALERGESTELGDISRFDDISSVSKEVVTRFYEHAKEVEDLPNRLALTAPAKVHHPIFGSLTSRGFYALLAMHLWIHVPQIEDQIKLHFIRPQPGHKT